MFEVNPRSQRRLREVLAAAQVRIGVGLHQVNLPVRGQPEIHARVTVQPQDAVNAFGENVNALGGAVGATRAVVDAGWYPYSAQIGQTGKMVSPKLYVALGISGAIQHKVGMQSASVIVSINKDPNAPIFDFSDLGVVGDLHEVVPKLTELIRQRRSE